MVVATNFMHKCIAERLAKKLIGVVVRGGNNNNETTQKQIIREENSNGKKDK